LRPEVYDVPREVEEFVATLKLRTMGIEIDRLTAEQSQYLQSWQMGT
jgi:adenosylhomocysteinase